MKKKFESKLFSMISNFFILFTFLGIFSSNLNATAVSKDPKFVDSICTYQKTKVSNNKNVYFYHPQLGKKWQKAYHYYLSKNKDSVSLNFGYGPVSVSYSKQGSDGYSVPADYSKYSKLKIRQTGDVYRITRNSRNKYYDFVEEYEYAYPIYK